MFNYAMINAVDPDYLGQFLNSTKTFAEAFYYPGDKKVSIDHQGQTINFHISMEEGLGKLWTEYAYDLVGNWGKIKSNLRSYLQESKYNRKKPLQELEIRTHCYDLEAVRTKGTWLDSELEMVLPPDMAQLTHEEVRQRVLCFVAMVMHSMKEDALQMIASAAPRNKNGSFTKNRVIRIARLGIYNNGTGNVGFMVWGRAIGPDDIELLVSSREFGDADLAQETNLFDFPTGEGISKAPVVETVTKKQENFSYSRIEQVFTLEHLNDIIETDNKGKRSIRRDKNRKFVCTVNDREFTVKCNLASELRKMWEYYTEELEAGEPGMIPNRYHDPEEVMRNVTVPKGKINDTSGVFEHSFPEHFPTNVNPLTPEQIRLRYLWFMRACALATTDEILCKIAELAPKKKNGTLHKGRLFRIAAFYACAFCMKPCPHCLSSFVNAEAMERAYISDESRYYHSNEVCPELGDSGSVRGAFAEQAQAQGKFRCPECNQTKPKDAAICEKTLGQSLSALREGYIFEREDVVGNRRIWYLSNGEEAKESCIYSVKETDDSEEPNDFSFDDLTKEFVAYLDVGFASREESLCFMKKVPEPIKSIYAKAPDVVREYVSELGLDKKLQTFGWVMVMRIYFDEDQQIGRCEMGFGDYGDGIVLDWGIEKDGSVRLIRKWQGVLNFFV